MGQQQNRDNRPSSSNVADDHANTLRSVGLIAWSRRPPTDADRIIARLEETVGSDSTVISQRILVQYAVDANSAPAGVETAELGAVRGWQVISADDWLSGQRAALKSLKTDSAMVVDFDRIGRADDLELLARHGQTTAWVQGRDIAPASSWWRRGLRLGVELFSWLTTRGGTRQSLSPALVLPRETWSEVVKDREWMVPPNHELAAVERVAIARQAGDRPLEVPVRLAEPAAPRSIIRTLFASVWSLLLVARIAWRQTWFPAREEQCDPAMGDGPRSEQQDTSPVPTPAWQWAIALLVMLGALPFFLGNLDFPLVEPDETRNVQIALEMHETGDYLLPTRHGSPYLDKPAMLFWSMAKSFEWFGRSEQAARLPIGFAGWLTVVGLIVVGSRRFGLFAATLGGLALMCCVGFAVVSRFVITDVLLTCTMTWAALSLHRGMGTKAWRGVWWTIAGAALGVGILTKGPVAPVLTLPPFLLWCWLERHANRRTSVLALGRGADAAGPAALVLVGRLARTGSTRTFLLEAQRRAIHAGVQSPTTVLVLCAGDLRGHVPDIDAVAEHACWAGESSRVVAEIADRERRLSLARGWHDDPVLHDLQREVADLHPAEPADVEPARGAFRRSRDLQSRGTPRPIGAALSSPSRALVAVASGRRAGLYPGRFGDRRT
ncbi:MAG: glycosyltransferase family 39 protein [Pirellulaceae bacterium]